MDPKTKERILRYSELLRSYLAWLLLGGVLLSALAFGYTVLRVPPVYEASITLVVNRTEAREGGLSASDLSAAASMTDICQVLLKDGYLLDRTIRELSLETDPATLQRGLSVSPVKDTPILQVRMRDTDPDEALRIVLKLSELSPGFLEQNVRAVSCRVIGDAYCSGVPVSPDLTRITQGYFLLGVVLLGGLLILWDYLRQDIRTEEQLEAYTALPILSVIPDHTQTSRKKGGKQP